MYRLRYIMVLFAAVSLCSACGEQKTEDAVNEADSVPQLVYRIQQCSRLYTTEYHIHKIITHEDVVRMKGNILNRDVNVALPFGERRMAIPMDATLKAWIDLSDFSEKNIVRVGRHISILLPDPQITLTSSKIQQKEVREYVGIMRSNFTDKEITSYQQQGRQAILESLDNDRFIREAQANAARVLVPLIVQMGYREEDISIVFRKDLDIDKLININIEKP